MPAMLNNAQLDEALSNAINNRYSQVDVCFRLLKEYKRRNLAKYSKPHPWYRDCGCEACEAVESGLAENQLSD